MQQQVRKIDLLLTRAVEQFEKSFGGPYGEDGLGIGEKYFHSQTP